MKVMGGYDFPGSCFPHLSEILILTYTLLSKSSG